MTEDAFDDLALETNCKEQFGFVCEVDKAIVRNIEVGRGARATVFLTKKKQLLVYIHGPARLLLGDVQKIASRMGVSVETIFPPKAHPEYFNDIARERFHDVFPGRKHITDDDLRFYRTLAPYSPALLAISEVRDGHIYRADSDARSGWRSAARFAYRRIRTS